MSSSGLPFRVICILSILTILNVMFLGFTWTRKDGTYGCSVDNVLDGLSRYIVGTGARSLEEVMAAPCIKSVGVQETKESLVSAIRGLVSICRRRNVSKELNRQLRKPLITLFTTWPETNDSAKTDVHKRTLRNWSSFKEKVEIVVFTNSSQEAKLAEEYGASVYPIEVHHGGGAPVLKWMFEKVKFNHILSLLYGYVNSDILFTENLMSTLEYIVRATPFKTPLFIVGRRTNVKNVTFNETDTLAGVEKMAKQRGELFHANAEDFFITNSAFPWKDILDVVVGRLAYDNWIVGHVICNMGIGVIDVTGTMTAVHQTTQSGGNFEGFKSKHAHYNNALFKKRGIQPHFESGFTICAQSMTFLDLCGEVQLQRRTDFWPECACPSKTGAPAKAA